MSKFKWYHNKKSTRWLKVSQVGFVPYLETSKVCPSCNDEITKISDAWIGKCKTCGALVSFFKGTPIQEIACSIQSPVIFNIGSVGSGKTTISSYIISNHMRRHPGAMVLATALTLEQLKKYAIPELEKFIHPSEIASKTQTHWVLYNGSQINFVASDNEDKLRSANATAMWIVEGAPNKIAPIFRQGLSRLRNPNAIEYEKDENGNVIMMKYSNGKVSPKIKSINTLMLVEANPKKGSWLKPQIMKSHTVFYTSSVKGIPILKQTSSPQRIISEFTGEEGNAQVVSILNATVDNPILTETFLSGLRAASHSQEEFDREIFCDLTSEDGLVFKKFIPKLNEIFIPMNATYSPDPEYVWVESIDPGGANDTNDPTCYLLMRLHKTRRTIDFVDGFYSSGLTLSQETDRIIQIRNRHFYTNQRSFLFTGDNVLERSMKVNKHQSLRTEYEIRLSSSIKVCNDKGIKQGVGIILSWLDAGAIKIADHLDFVKREIIGYEYIVKKEVVKDVIVENQKFSVGNDHAIDVIRYALVMLESMGIRQDQHRIDFQNRLQNPVSPQTSMNNYNTNVSQMIINTYLPNFDEPVYEKKRYKI